MTIDKRQILKQAHKLLDKGLNDRAIKEYQRIVDADPGDVFALQKIAELHCRNQAYASAIEYYEQSFQVLLKKGFHEKCIALLKRIIELDPGRLESYRALAKCQTELGRVEEAVQTLKTLIGAFERKGERQESLRLLKDLAKLTPADWTNRVRLAEGYAALGKNILAIENFKQVLSALEQAENHQEFDRVAERALYLYPDQTEIAVNLSRSYLSQSRFREALSWLQILFKSNPKDPDTLSLLGDAFLSQGRKEKALAVYREARKILKQQGREVEADDIRERLLQVDPDLSVSMVAPRNVPAHTSQPPKSLDAELPTAVLLGDALILCEFSLFDHAVQRLDVLPEDFIASGPNRDKVLRLMHYREDNGDEALNARITALTARMTEAQGPAEDLDDSIDAKTAEQAVQPNEKADSKAVKGLAINLEDEVNLDELDFSGFDEDSSLVTESALDHIDTRELTDETFDFEVQFDEGSTNSVDEFADLLDDSGSNSIADTSEDATSAAIVAGMETRERFPRIRPLMKPQVKAEPDPDRTEEVSALTDDFMASHKDDIGDRKSSQAASKQTTKARLEAVDDDEFGGLLEPDE